MENWRDWLRTLTVLVVVISLSEAMLPNNELKKFSKLALGLVLMLAVLQPVLSLMHLDWDPDLPLVQTSAVRTDWSQKADEIRQAGTRPLMKHTERSASRQLESILLTNSELHSVQVGLTISEDGIIRRVDVTLEPHRRLRPVQIGMQAGTDQEREPAISLADTKQQVRRIVAHYLQIGEADVSVRLSEPWGGW